MARCMQLVLAWGCFPTSPASLPPHPTAPLPFTFLDSVQCPGSGPGVPALLFHWANFSLFFKTQLQSNPNHDTTRKPPLIFLRLGKMPPSGLLVAPGCPLGGSCVCQVPNVPAALGPGPGPSRCWKACSEQNSDMHGPTSNCSQRTHALQVLVGPESHPGPRCCGTNATAQPRWRRLVPLCQGQPHSKSSGDPEAAPLSR